MLDHSFVSRFVKQIKMNKCFRLIFKSLQIDHYCPLVFQIQFYHMQMLLS